MFVKRYIKEPFKYAMSDWKKIFVGGVFGIIGYLPLNTLNIFLYSMGDSLNMDASHLPIILISFAIKIFAILLLLIISIIQMGYYIKISKNTVESINILPEWENFRALIKNGLMYYIASTILGLGVIGISISIMALVGALIVAIILLVIGNAITMTTMLIVGGYGILCIFILIILSILVSIYTPLAMVNLAKKGFMGFFEFKYILKLISFEYILMLIVLGIVLIIILIITNIPYIILTSMPESYNNMLLLYLSEMINTITTGFITFFLAVIFYKAVSNYYVDRIKRIQS